MVSSTDKGAMNGLIRVTGSRHVANAIQVREALIDYLNSEQGEVPWQWSYVRSTGPVAT